MDCLYERVGTDVHGVHMHIHTKSRRGCQFTFSIMMPIGLSQNPGTPVCILLTVFIPYIAWVTGVPGVCYLGARIQLCSLEQAFNN